MKLKKLFQVLVVGGTTLGMGIACGGSDGSGTGGSGGTGGSTQQLLPDGGLPDGGTPTGGGGGGGGGPQGW